MTRRLLGGLVMTSLAFVLIARADDPAKEGGDKIDPKAASEIATNKTDQMRRQFSEFENALLRLKQRLADSPRQEDRQKAIILEQAMKKASQEGIDTKFNKLVELVADTKTFDDLTKLEAVIASNHQLMEDVKLILNILLTDNRDEQLAIERRKLENMLKWLAKIRGDQVITRAWTDRNALSKERLAKEQNNIAKEADALAKGQPKPAEDKGDQRVAKADTKNEGKNGKGQQGEGKEDAKDPKVGDKTQDGKQGDPKNDKQDDAKDNKGDAKSGDGKPGDSKQGDAKDGKPGDAKSGQPKDGKPGDAKSGDAKDGKSGEAKSGEPKKGDAKSADAKDGKPSDPKSEGKPTDAKSGDSKSASKGKGDGKGQGKPGEGKDGQGGQQSAQSKSQSGQSGQSGSGQGKGDQQPQQAQQQPPQKQDDQGSTAPARKKIAEAVERMIEAEKKIKVPDNDKATEEQTEAIKKLDEAKRKLEDLLRQLREEEIERLLAALQMRAERMLAMQIEVRDGTVKVFKDIEEHESKKADRADQQASNKLSDKEEEIIREANKAIQILSAEGSSVAFPEVFTDLRDEMVKVSRLLRATNVSLFTQRTENDIIAALKEVIEALKKARQDNQNKKPPQPGQGGGQGNQKLIELLQELKMIRSLQVRVNKRTEDYAREYQGEQAPAAATARSPEEREKVEIINKELKGLGERQKKIGDITDNLRKNLQQQ